MKTTHYLQMSAMSFAALLLLLVTFVSADSHGTSQYLVHDPKSAEELSEAIDAAIMTVLSKPKWFSNLKNTHQYVQAHLVTTCSPSPSKWQWPDKASATGLLKRVFDSNELKVAGVQWASQIADYTTDGLNPTGYWADYLQAIVDEFNAHYSTSVQIRRIYYPNSVEVGDRVADGTVDMSEPYYYLGGFHGGKPRIESLHFSCVTAGTAGIFIVKSDARINTLDALNSAIASGSNKKIGCACVCVCVCTRAYWTLGAAAHTVMGIILAPLGGPSPGARGGGADALATRVNHEAHTTRNQQGTRPADAQSTEWGSVCG